MASQAYYRPIPATRATSTEAEFSVGYNLAPNRCLSMDFHLGLGVTHFSYDTFTVTGGYQVYKGRNLSKTSGGPTQAGTTLV